MMPRSTFAIRLWGNSFIIHTGWLLLFSGVAIVTLKAIEPDGLLTLDAIVWYAAGVALIIGFLASLGLHEIGHAWLARRLSMGPELVGLYPFGGADEGFADPGAPWQDTLVALAGPLVSALLGGCLAALWWVIPHGFVVGRRDLGLLALGNLGLAGINLLPAYPLDGGRVFRAIVWYLHDDYTVGSRAAVAYSQLITFFFLASGLAILMVDSRAALWGLWIFVVSWVLNRSARGELARTFFLVTGSQLSAGETVEGMNPRLDAGQSIEESVDLLLSREGAAPAVVTDEGRIVGVLTLSQVRQVRRADWPTHTAGQVMVPIGTLPTVAHDASVRDMLAWLSAIDSDLLVVTRGSEIVGVIDRRLVVHRLFERARSRYRLTR